MQDSLQRRKITLLPFLSSWGEPREGDGGIPVWGRGACPCYFCLLPSHLSSFPGKFPGMGLWECRWSPIPGNFQGKEGRQGARWEGGASLGTQEADILLLPRVSDSYFLINWECRSFVGDFQMFPFSSQRLQGRIPHGYGNYCWQRGGGQTPAMMGRGGSIGPPAPPRIPSWPHPAPPHPGVARSLLPAPSPWPLVLPPACALLPWG